jgi:hypothetical protein
MDENQQIFENLFKVVMTASEARMHSVLHDDKIELVKEKFPNLMPGEWVSLILLSSDQLRIFFKIFFDVQTIQTILEEKKISIFNEVEKENMLKDFMREYCNLVGGYINATLEKLELQMTMSLPLALKGFDDFFFPFADSKNSFEKQWSLKCLDNQFFCTCLVEIFDAKSLENFRNFVPEPLDLKEGDVDFL